MMFLFRVSLKFIDPDIRTRPEHEEQSPRKRLTGYSFGFEAPCLGKIRAGASRNRLLETTWLGLTEWIKFWQLSVVRLVVSSIVVVLALLG